MPNTYFLCCTYFRPVDFMFCVCLLFLFGFCLVSLLLWCWLCFDLFVCFCRGSTVILERNCYLKAVL